MTPACFQCAQLFAPTPNLDGELITCTAFFPEPIPGDIMNGEVAHTAKHPDQSNEVVFLDAVPTREPG